MTDSTKMYLRILKIAAIIAIACICVSPAMGQQAASVQPAKDARGASPAVEPQTPFYKQQFRIFQLRYNDAETMIRVLYEILSGKEGFRMAVDRQKNVLIAMGTEEQLQTFGAIVDKLDIPGRVEQNRTSPINVRVIWLVDGVDSAAVPAENLKEVVEELHRQGLKNIGQLAQIMARSQNDGNFQISCSPLLDNNTVMLTVRGIIHPESKLEVSISASEERAQGMGGGGRGGMGPGPGGMNTLNLVNINVTTVYKTNEYIVLAVAPIGKITSAFVIQITEGKP